LEVSFISLIEDLKSSEGLDVSQEGMSVGQLFVHLEIINIRADYVMTTRI
jgi:hypothetical protein